MAKEMIAIYNTCPWCGKNYLFEVPYEGLEKWRGGEMIQNAFPEVNATIREHLLTGYCEDCQEKLFGEDDEPEDDDDYEPDDYDECGFNPYMGCYDYDCQKEPNGSFLLGARPTGHTRGRAKFPLYHTAEFLSSKIDLSDCTKFS